MRTTNCLLAILAVGALTRCGGSKQNSGSAGAAGEAVGGNSGSLGSSGAGASSGGALSDAGVAGQDIGVGAEAGEAGAAGAVAVLPHQACVQDADCSDHLACTGVETCVGNKCLAGVPPCTVTDAVNCVAVCTEVNGAAACAVQGMDADKDGHRSAACTAAPGDDCNDSVATVFKDAPELCDHLDNDCDGKVDLNDGLSLSGSATSSGPNFAGSGYVAYASDKSLFAVLARASGTSDLTVDVRNPAGSVVVPPVGISQGVLSTGSSVYFAGGGDSFGAVWTAGLAGTFRSIASDGTLGPIARVNGTAFAHVDGLARVPGGNWGVEFNTNAVSGLVLETVSAAGVASGVRVTMPSDISSNLVATSAGFVVLRVAADTLLPSLAMWSPALDSPTTLPISGAPATLATWRLASGPNGLALSMSTASAAPQIYLFGPAGNKLCGPLSYADKDFVPAQITASTKGYLVLSATTRVQEIFSDCTSGQSFAVQTNAVSAPSIAGGAAGFAVGWDDTDGPHIHRFGPDFCN